MSNWRSAGRMRPHSMFHAARHDLLYYPYNTENYNKLKKNWSFQHKTIVKCYNRYSFSIFYKDFDIKCVLNQKKRCKFVNCGPKTAFWLLKPSMRPAPCFEFDMAGIDSLFLICRNIKNISLWSRIFNNLKMCPRIQNI